MNIEGWRYYNHAAIPTTPPHIEPDTEVISNGNIWNSGGRPLLARWTTDFDCGYETNWWYVIKDTPFDVSSLKAKRRYEINKGIKNFYVKEIVATEYVDRIYEIQVAAYSQYPIKYRPTMNRENLTTQIKDWNWYKTYGVFSRENDLLVGYALLNRRENYVYYAVQKVIPEFESKGINAALVNHILQEHGMFLQNGGYINDGARNIQHETAFQNYLEKYFGFRKAYCKLHIVYNPKIKPLIKILYPFRNVLSKLDSVRIIHQINGVLKMEKIIRSE